MRRRFRGCHCRPPSHRLVTEFSVQVLTERAEDVLAEQRVFGANARQWSAFVGLLDEPARPVTSWSSCCSGRRSARSESLHPAGTADWGPPPRGFASGTPPRLQGAGLGASLLQDAVRRVAGVGDDVGIRALLVHAIEEPAAAFYRRFGFITAPMGDRTLVLPIQNMQESLRRSLS